MPSGCRCSSGSAPHHEFVTTLTYTPRLYRIQIDDEAEQSLPMWGLLLCSFDGAGERLMLAPGADSGDGKLDLIMLGNLGRWESLTRVVPKLGDGTYIEQPKIFRRHARSPVIAKSKPTPTVKGLASCRCRSRCYRSA